MSKGARRGPGGPLSLGVILLGLTVGACNALTGADGFEVGLLGDDAGQPSGDASVPTRDAAQVDGAAPVDGGGGADASADGGASDGGATDGGDAGPIRKIVFVTNATMTADFGGVAGGDARCNQAAQSANLPGTFVAWLSTRSGVEARLHVTAAGPWYLVTGPLAVTRAQLTNSPITNAIARTETGALVGGVRLVWTGTNTSGRSSGEDCKGWLTADGTEGGGTGNANVSGAAWTAADKSDCNDPASLYCFEN